MGEGTKSAIYDCPSVACRRLWLRVHSCRFRSTALRRRVAWVRRRCAADAGRGGCRRARRPLPLLGRRLRRAVRPVGAVARRPVLLRLQLPAAGRRRAGRRGALPGPVPAAAAGRRHTAPSPPGAERQRSSVPDGCGGRSMCAMVITGDQLLVQVDRQVRERHLAERQRAIEPL